MTATSLQAALASRPYPGRGALVARTGDGTLCFAYLITGRSASSQARALRILPNGDVAVADTSGNGDIDALRHYEALAQRGKRNYDRDGRDLR